MDLANFLHDLFFDYTVRTVAGGSVLLGLVSGALGVFALLRRQSLLGDTISHAALPGVVVAFLLMRSKSTLVLLVGAMLAGWLGTLWIMAIVRHSRIKLDSALAIVLSVFFGLGMVLLSYTQRLPDASQAGLNKFLFGQAATMLSSDVQTIGLLGGAAILVLLLFWKEFKLLSFDRDFATGLGFATTALDLLLTTLLVIAIVIGLQAVGVVLMSAMIIAPAVAARQWSERLWVVVALSAFFGGLSGLAGVLISSTRPGLATGPVIVVAASSIAVLSLLFAPERGLLAARLKVIKNNRRIRADAVMQSLYHLGRSHGDPAYPHAEATLRTMSPAPAKVRQALLRMEQQGLVKKTGVDSWALTEQGTSQAERLENGRREQ